MQAIQTNMIAMMTQSQALMEKLDLSFLNHPAVMIVVIVSVGIMLPKVGLFKSGCFSIGGSYLLFRLWSWASTSEQEVFPMTLFAVAVSLTLFIFIRWTFFNQET